MRRFLIPMMLAAVVGSAAGGWVAMGPAGASTTVESSPAPGQTESPGRDAPAPAAPAAVATSLAPVTYSYGPHGAGNTLDVYAPAPAAEATLAHPAIVLVHGGSWIRGSRKTLAAEARQFAELGYVAIPVGYRLATEAPWPAQRNDVRAALRWIRAEALTLNLDPDRIVVLGSSAGAEVAAAALTFGQGSNLAAGLVSLSGPLDKVMIVDRADLAASAARLATVVTGDLLGCTPTQCPIKYWTASPKNHIDPGDVPSLLFTSRREWVDPQGTYDFHAAARTAGLPSKLVVLEGKVHARNYWEAAWPTIRTWVAARTAGPPAA